MDLSVYLDVEYIRYIISYTYICKTQYTRDTQDTQNRGHTVHTEHKHKTQDTRHRTHRTDSTHRTVQTSTYATEQVYRALTFMACNDMRAHEDAGAIAHLDSKYPMTGSILQVPFFSTALSASPSRCFVSCRTFACLLREVRLGCCFVLCHPGSCVVMWLYCSVACPNPSMACVAAEEGAGPPV
jgi:hypothetical protein